jgi:hypothetical protein
VTRVGSAALLAAFLGLVAAPVRAEEGMWLVDDFPAERVRKAYGFTPTAEWLDHVRRSAVRLSGCSASFVSPDGMVMTNHHCARECIEDLSSATSDYLANGFYAADTNAEQRCPKLEANQLVGITDVTARVQAATQGKEEAAFGAAQRAEISRIESDCAKDARKQRCDVVTLFHGGRYHLYEYKRFQDVRLVFAPEFQMAAFGGYPDNFNFPRYGIDMAFLRVWEDDRPGRTDHYFRWAREGAKENDLTFVAGHPGGTERNQTIAQLEFQRDVAVPFQLLRLSELRGLLRQAQTDVPGRERYTKARLRGIENTHKALRGRHDFLADPELLARKRAEDTELRRAVEASPELRPKYGSAWDAIERALARHRELFLAHSLRETPGITSDLFTFARQLVRAAGERARPNAERLREYTDAQLPSMEQRIVRPAPIEPDLEELTLAFSLRQLRDILGVDDPYVRRALDGKPPEVLARELVRGTKLGDAAVREALWKGGPEAVATSGDPLIAFAARIDPFARQVRKQYEDEVEAPIRKAGEQIAQAVVAVRGTSGYPDATFTLRLSYGQVKGWKEGDRAIPALTFIRGLYERHTGEPWFTLSPPWLRAKSTATARHGETPLDLASTHDVIGGNSGSPMFDRNGEIVGLIFDGNLPSLGGRYLYDPEKNRTVAVHGEGILKALRVYGARRVLAELGRDAP